MEERNETFESLVKEVEEIKKVLKEGKREC